MLPSWVRSASATAATMPGLSRPMADTAKWRIGSRIRRLRMSPEQLSSERRRGRIAAVAAIASGLAFAVGAFWYQVVNADAPDGKHDAASCSYFDRHSGEYLAASILQVVGILLLVVVATHLYRAAKARNPDQATVVLVTGVYGPIAFAISTLVRAVTLSILADDFAGRAVAAQTEKAADDLLNTPALVVATAFGLTGVLAIGFWLVKGSLDAMRLGLLTRFMGVLGIALGPALVLGFGLFVLPLWLLALGVLFAGYWPRGMPPAWRTGRAEPWQVASDAGDVGVVEDIPEPPGAGRNGEVEAIGPGVRKPGADPEGKGHLTGHGCGRVSQRRWCWRAWAPPHCAACGEAQIDAGKAEAAIKRGLTRQTGIEIRSVSCPEDVKVERGGKFRCEAVARNGDRAHVLVTQRDDDGTITWRVVPSR